MQMSFVSFFYPCFIVCSVVHTCTRTFDLELLLFSILKELIFWLSNSPEYKMASITTHRQEICKNNKEVLHVTYNSLIKIPYICCSAQQQYYHESTIQFFIVYKRKYLL